MVACASAPVSVKTSPLASPSAAMSSEPTISPAEAPLSLSTIQRLDAYVGYIASWTGAGPVLARTTDGGSTWQTIPVPAARLTSLHFIDPRVGWAGAFIEREVPQVACEQAPPTASSPCYGAVLRTQDGGATWQKSLLVPYQGTYPDPVLEVQAIDGQIAWALVLTCSLTTQPRGLLGCPTELRHTVDGGRTWSAQTAGYIAEIRFATPAHGWLAAINPDGSSDIKTTLDGGVTWTSHLRATSGSVVGLDAADSSRAWVMTQDGGYCSASTCDLYELFRTTDGGNSWSSLGNPKTTAAGTCRGGHFVGPLFATASRGWLAENTGAGGAKATTGLLTTDDGGVTWRCLAQPSNTYLVSAADPTHLWVTSNRLGDDATTLFASDDGGTSWRQLSLAALGGAAPVHQ
jgi:photosystem II stability/assembly factor-like uncharacterized protein